MSRFLFFALGSITILMSAIELLRPLWRRRRMVARLLDHELLDVPRRKVSRFSAGSGRRIYFR